MGAYVCALYFLIDPPYSKRWPRLSTDAVAAAAAGSGAWTLAPLTGPPNAYPPAANDGRSMPAKRPAATSEASIRSPI